MTFAETGPLRFVWALNRARRQHHLTQWSLADFNSMRCYLSEDEKTGLAITADGEITCLFNIGEKGAGGVALAVAQLYERKPLKLSCFAGLENYYKSRGFRTIRREPFDPKLAPADWPEDEGTPDVVYMEYRP